MINNSVASLADEVIARLVSDWLASIGQNRTFRYAVPAAGTGTAGRLRTSCGQEGSDSKPVRMTARAVKIRPRAENRQTAPRPTEDLPSLAVADHCAVSVVISSSSLSSTPRFSRSQRDLAG
jgi:hypothetical protein